MDKAHTAIHEAGHAVAHVRLEIDHDGASIAPDPEKGRLGYALGHGQEGVWDERSAENMVLAFCAGYAALIAVGCADNVARCGANDDFEQAQELMVFWGLAGSLDTWQEKVVELMRQPENVAAVALVAKHLLQRKRLDGGVVDVLVEVADGHATEAEFERYLTMRRSIGQEEVEE